MRLSSFSKHPIIQAPMAGGTANPTLAAAVCNAGGLGFLAAGYKTGQEVREEIKQTRKLTSQAFGVNLFVPSEDTVASTTLDDYAGRLEHTAKRLAVSPGDAKNDDDDWETKLEVMIDEHIPIVSFTFGCPAPSVLDRLKQSGSYVIVTVTSPEEATEAAQAGADALCLQGIEAGGHRSSFQNNNETEDFSLLPLLRLVKQQVDLPLIAAGGIMHGQDIAALLIAGAEAVQLGTAFLRCPESGAKPLHKQALADNRFSGTTVTRAFTGRRARGLKNAFIQQNDEAAPAAYPFVHYMTKPIRKAAAEAKDLEAMALWAGQGYQMALDLPAAEIVSRLVEQQHEALQAQKRL
ncbi:NAD(P)H-dependent flavin oxidoreductase [Sediminibacillus halophilus]|uniref:Probable nitronate monooxygenase n=1 Tax=Sediminibacillus halophilus TaxID=482461 RepID=A0A1G9TCP9_9BACI|nr:nitronate monooxygenase [Sediminibacillus halophilus]SDM45519.1 nitronate monooxygenase [Sediminibacillus halophilus]